MIALYREKKREAKKPPAMLAKNRSNSLLRAGFRIETVGIVSGIAGFTLLHVSDPLRPGVQNRPSVLVGFVIQASPESQLSIGRHDQK